MTPRSNPKSKYKIIGTKRDTETRTAQFRFPKTHKKLHMNRMEEIRKPSWLNAKR